MIYLFCALYTEARGLISHYGLKKDPADNRCQVFYNADKEICLTVTGPGEVAAAAAVGSICTKYHAGHADMLLNIGTCAAVALPAAAEYRTGASGGRADAECLRAEPVLPGSAFLCSRLVEAATGKTFYPDMIYRHGFRERGIVTGMKIIDDAEAGFCTGFCGVPGGMPAACAEDGFFLYDMEAAAVYQAGAYFFGPHQMSFVKIVSDAEILRAEGAPAEGAPGRDVRAEAAPADLSARKLSKEGLIRIMEDSREEITAYIDLLRSAAGGRDGGSDAPGGEADAAFAETLCRDLCCSQTMRAVLHQHLRYCALAGIDYRAAAEAMYRDGKLPCRDKREGKLRFEELRQKLL